MLLECSFAKATAQAKGSLDVPRGDAISVDIVSTLKAGFSATGTFEGFVGFSSSWLDFPSP